MTDGEKSQGFEAMAGTSSREEIRSRVVEILRRDLKLGNDARIDDDMPFFNSEADLDSLDILLLVASVEKAFGIKIANEEVGQSAFQNVRSLTQFIATQVNGNGAVGASRAVDYLANLPHGEPFRFISKITAMKPGEAGTGVWNLAGSEVFFAGHFPGRPMVPGVLIAEALAQLSGIVGTAAGAGPGGEGSLAHVDVRFDKPVVPPAEIILKSTFLRQMGQLQQFEVSAEVSGETVARGTLALHRAGGGA
jgi:3-hydroxyacyl-[acyl-carrier-protein] dehydratase